MFYNKFVKSTSTSISGIPSLDTIVLLALCQCNEKNSACGKSSV